MSLNYLHVILYRHEDVIMQTQTISTCTFCILEKATGYFLPFKMCAEHEKYFVQLDNSRPPSGKVFIQLMTEFVVPIQQYENRLENKAMRFNN